MKRKKKEDDETKEPKPKKYKKKIENPEKQRARYVYDNKGTNGKLWEKNRRDRLNNTFDELALLLPPKDPPGKMSKVEILSGAIKELEDLRKKLQEIEQSRNDKDASVKDIKQVEVSLTSKKDASCNTDVENKENIGVSKSTNAHKKIQVNLIRKKRKESKLVTTETQTLSSEKMNETVDTSVKTSCSDAQQVTNSCLALVPFSERNEVSSVTNYVKLTSEPIKITQNGSNSSTHLSHTMRVTPALISTPIMTPSLFISNYPLIVSQVPQSVYIVNNKTETNTTVNKVVAVKSKSISGHVPLPPLKKSVAVKKPPRKKRVLKKKNEDGEPVENTCKTMEKVKIDEGVTNSKTTESISEISVKSIEENNEENTKEKCPQNTEREKHNEKPKNTDNVSDPKINDESSEKQLNEVLLPITPIATGKLLERLDSSSSLLNLERKSFSPVSHDTSHINDTSAISNLDIENFSLLTANILSGIDANDTSETNLSSNIGKILEDKELDCSTKSNALTTNKELLSGNQGKAAEKCDSISSDCNVPKHRETIQVRKGLLQNEPKISIQQNQSICSELVSSSASYNNFNVVSTTVQSINYPNFSLSLSQEVRNRSKSEANAIISSKHDVSAAYTMTGPSYSSNLNYSGYYCNTSTSLQQLYSNQNNMISSNYAKNYDSQRPYYADQPSTNFTFSLTSAGKSHAKYVSSGNKSYNIGQVPLPNSQEPCKKYNSSKTASYNHVNDSISGKNMPSHSIARLNSKYDNHKENNTPFYLNSDANACTKASSTHKSSYNQPVFSHNSSSCARYPQQQQIQSSNKQTNSNKNTKNTSISTHQMSSRYDVDWMSSSEIKPITNDFQLFPTLDSGSTNQNTYYSSTISNFDINRKTSDLYFAHPPGEENLPWSPSRMSNILDGPHLSQNQCFSSTLPNLHGDLALNTLSTGGSSRPSSIFETTPTKAGSSSYNHAYPSAKETKRVANPVESQQNNSFSVRQLVDIHQPSKSSNDKLPNMKRKSSSRKEGDSENYDVITFENQKSNIYSAESLINTRHSLKSKSWHTETNHSAPTHDLNQNNALFSVESASENQYNYSTTRYDPKYFNQNYVTSFVDNSFSNSTQNFHNFSKSQAFPFAESNSAPIDYHQSSLGNTMNSFLSHHDATDKQNYYSQSSKSLNPSNVDLSASRNNHSSTSTSIPSKKSKSSHHVPTSTHHSLIMNYDFPVPPVTPSLTYFPTHDWKSTPTEPYHNTCNTNSYANSPNFYSQNILQNSQTQNLVSGLSSNNSGSQNTSNSLTNFNLSTICPEINDKVRQQNW